MEQTLLDDLKDKREKQKFRVLVERDNLTTLDDAIKLLEGDRLDIKQLEGSRDFVDAVWSPRSLRMGRLPRPQTVGDAVYEALGYYKKGADVEMLVKYVRGRMPHATEGAVRSFLERYVNDPRKPQDIKVSGGKWLRDKRTEKTLAVEDKRTHEEKAQATAAAFLATNRSTKPVKPYQEGTIKAAALRFMQERAPSSLSVDQIAEGVKQLGIPVKNRSALSFLYLDLKRPQCPFVLTAPGMFRAKRVYNNTTEEQNEGNGNGNGTKRKYTRTPEQRAATSRAMKKSYKERAAARKKAEEEKLEKLEKRDLINA